MLRSVVVQPEAAGGWVVGALLRNWSEKEARKVEDGGLLSK